MGDSNNEQAPSDQDRSDRGEGAAHGDNATARGRRSSPHQRGKRRSRRGKAPQGAEPRDDREAQALDFLREVLAKMDMECEVQLVRKDPDDPAEIALDISGHDAARIIGKKGQVLSALQFLVNRAINRPDLERRFISVDAEGYRSRRDDTLASMAQRLGKQAIELGKIITFEPMSPRDRRVVHLALAKLEGVVTKSEGEGDDRRVQIIPVRR